MPNKRIFNFWLDDDVREEATNKLSRMAGDSTKGRLASLIRVLLRQFVATPDDKVNPLLIEATMAEYEFSQKLNKRSRL